jgi:chaperone modulatory protein CbpM
MIWTFQQVVMEMEVSEGEVTRWIEQSWVLPVEEDGKLLFDDIDRARIQLIVELRRDLEVNEEAIPVVLRLLDQVYGLRRTLDELRLGIQGVGGLAGRTRGDPRANPEAKLIKTRRLLGLRLRIGQQLFKAARAQLRAAPGEIFEDAAHWLGPALSRWRNLRGRRALARASPLPVRRTGQGPGPDRPGSPSLNHG